MLVISRAEVRELLDDRTCIELMRTAMIALSNGQTIQTPRQIITLSIGIFGVMPGALGANALFGAKLISVFSGNRALGGQSHQGGIMLFEGGQGAAIALVHAGEITAIRTAAASAFATDILARVDAAHLAVLGYGEQAAAHIRAMMLVRPIKRVTVWGRDTARAERFAQQVSSLLDVECEAAADVSHAAQHADIICTTTSASDPILFGADIAIGTHVNVVGSSHAGPAEIDIELVRTARFFGDCRAHVLSQGAEFIRAREADMITDTHFLAEVGEVAAGDAVGRQTRDDITVYKSLGHIVQDLAAAEFVYEQALSAGHGVAVSFD